MPPIAPLGGHPTYVPVAIGMFFVPGRCHPDTGRAPIGYRGWREMTTRTRKAEPVPAKLDFDALLDEAALAESIVPICLRGDLVAEHEALDRQLAQLLEQPVTKLGGDGRGELQQQIRALEEQMTAATVTFRFRALVRADWHAFVAEHPPRPDDEGDARRGINRGTFFEALVRRCLVEPVVSAEQWARLDQVLTDRQFDQLADAAWAINRRDVDVPFSEAASRLSRSSGAE